MIEFSLDKIEALLSELGNPQDKLSFIHIAGTNGKGSTGAFLSYILKEAGLKVGSYSSPAVFSDEEIIKINNRPILKKLFKEETDNINSLCEALSNKGITEISEFEKLTALAFKYFADNKCDIVVLETGLGGKGDATNIVKNTVLSLFTSISRDHTEYLGKSLHNIASVKAGIMKKGCIAVSIMQEKEASEVLLNEAIALNVPLIFIKESDTSAKNTKDTSNQCFDIHIKSVPQNFGFSIDEVYIKSLSIKMAGSHQIKNAALAVYAAYILNFIENDRINFKGKISEKVIRDGLHKAKNDGRFEKVHTSPTIILDGAHNIGGALALRDAIFRYYKNKDIIGIVGMLNDKEHDAVLKETAPLFKMLFTVSTLGKRGYSASDLAEAALPYNKSVTSIGGIEEAIELALMAAGKSGVIIIYGSLSFLGAAKKHIRRIEG